MTIKQARKVNVGDTVTVEETGKRYTVIDKHKEFSTRSFHKESSIIFSLSNGKNYNNNHVV